jgi:diguanylate cyclase (GGDEF)-like protein
MRRGLGKWLARLEHRIVERRDSTGMLMLIEATLPFLLLLWGMQWHAVGRPVSRALFKEAWIAPSLWAQGLLMLWLVAMGVLAWRRRHDPAALPWLVQLTLVPGGLGVLLLCLGYGMKDTPMSMVLLAELVFARALFPLRQLIPVLLLCIATALGMEVADAMGVFPYAPLLSAPVFQGGPLAPWWTVWTRVVLVVAALPITALLFFVATALHRHRRALETLVRTDGLTGLVNRREFMTRLEREAHRQVRSGRPLSIVMFDVDHFKRVNDGFGHPVGDEVLARIGHLLGSSTRENVDTAARYGGEEFVLLLPETDLSGAQQVAEKISAKLRAQEFAAKGLTFKVTQSVGVAQVVQGDTAWALRVADRNLYQAKQAGRDRIVATVAFAPVE